MRKYVWPLVLFVGVPFVADIGRSVIVNVYDMSASGSSGPYESSLWFPGVGSFTSAVVLGVLYPLLRNTERSILRLAWSYTLVLQGMGALVSFGAIFAGYGDSLSQVVLVYMVGALLSFLPLLWLARRASRAGLAHAFFLVFIVEGLTLPGLPEALPFYFGWLWELAEGVLAAWLLANFEARGLSFRRSAAVLVVVLEGLVYLSLLWLSLVFLVEIVVILLLFPVQLVLIYLVRVRRAAGAGPSHAPRGLSGPP